MSDAGPMGVKGPGGLGSVERAGRTKSCTDCGEVKPLDEFHRNRAAADGRLASCGKCRNRSERTRRGADPDRRSRENKRYREKNPHIVWQHEYRARCSRYGIPPTIVPFTRAQLVERWGEHCVYCSVGMFEQVDHLLPIAAGGPHNLDNVVPACRRCNQAKLHLYDWPAIREFRVRPNGALGDCIPDLAMIRLVLANWWLS